VGPGRGQVGACAKAIILEMELRTEALRVLCIADPSAKALATRALPGLAGLCLDRAAALLEPEGLPGRPALPKLVPADRVPRRSPFTPAGRAALLHAICHIEFNAINLALDAIWRFPGLPETYYRDWLQVATEEALHFALLQEHLHSLGHAYGDFDAHDGLWTMVCKTSGDVLARMALVPRTLEARGLDATPPIQAKLRQAGDHRAVAILDIILHDEVGHVAIGNHWYRWLCERDGFDAHALYPALVERYRAPRLKGPFNLEARRAAGFSDAELAWLEGLAKPPTHASGA
jgi:uncharacterized ferritin-like protein (DUF455 family)